MRQRTIVLLMAAGLVTMWATWAGATTFLTEDFESGQGTWTQNSGTWTTEATPADPKGLSWKSPDGVITRASKSFDSGTSDVIRIKFDFYTNSAATNTQRCWGGLQDVGANQTPVVDNAMMRIGTNNLANYQFHYWSTALQVVDTGVPLAVGWHSVEIKATMSTQVIDWKIDTASGSVTNTSLVVRPNGVVLGYNYSNGSAGDPDTSVYYDNIVVDDGGAAATYQLNTSVVGGNGTIAPPSGPQPANSVVNLTASPNPGYQVKQWTGTDNDTLKTNANTVTMTSAKTVTVEFEAIVVCVRPVMTAAVSKKVHGTAGTFSIDLLAAGATECRKNGATTVEVTFDRAIALVTGTPADVAVTSGSVTAVAAAGSVLTVTCSGMTANAKTTMTFPGVADAQAGCATSTSESSLCIRNLYGDAAQSGGTNVIDMSHIKSQVNKTVTDQNFRNDVDATGGINVLDMNAVKGNLNKTVTACP